MAAVGQGGADVQRRSEEVGVPPSDAEAITASHQQPQAFAEIFDRHYDAIAAYLRRRVEPALGDELAAETFLQAFDARARYDVTRADARPWLYGIASNLLRRHRRAEERRLRAYARAATRAGQEPDLDAVVARLDAGDAAGALATALASLGPGERDVLLLHAWTELTYEEIADALDLPVGTVRSRLHRARHIVRELLAPTGEASEDPIAAACAASREELR
jgi:RNA polymerase sigma factor (sigma-70 family)